jgi:hypothetical protein
LKCSISECSVEAIQTVKIGFKETRNLCKYHYNLLINKKVKYMPDFKKASKFNEK